MNTKGEMMANTSLTLGKHWESFIKEEVSDGRYASASEVVRAGLRLLEEHKSQSKIEKLRAALIEGELSGDAGPLDLESLRQEVKHDLGLTN